MAVSCLYMTIYTLTYIIDEHGRFSCFLVPTRLLGPARLLARHECQGSKTVDFQMSMFRLVPRSAIYGVLLDLKRLENMVLVHVGQEVFMEPSVR